MTNETVLNDATAEILLVCRKYALSFDESRKLDNEMSNDVIIDKIEELLLLCANYEE